MTAGIFEIQTQNGFRGVLSKDVSFVLNLARIIHTKPLLEAWETPSFEFDSDASKKIPGATTLYYPGMVLLAGSVVRELEECCVLDCELLPVLVGGEFWFLINSKHAHLQVDYERSRLTMGPNGKILLIDYVVAFGSEMADIFCLSNVNGPALFCSSNFVSQMGRLGVVGLDFSEIGVFDS